MLRTVPPHDLVGMCIKCGTTLAEMSERTGIPERELLLFSLGQIGLKATDRFAILTELCESMTRAGIEPTSSSHPLTHEARMQLMSEVEQEDWEENSD